MKMLEMNPAIFAGASFAVFTTPDDFPAVSRNVRKTRTAMFTVFLIEDEGGLRFSLPFTSFGGEPSVSPMKPFRLHAVFPHVEARI
jgi:hypothetical protein